MNLLFRMLTLSVLITSVVIGMERPGAMGLLTRTMKDNCLVRTCAKCCTAECCPLATWVVLTEMHLCACIVNPEFNSKCPPRGELLAVVGAGLLGVLGVKNYIEKSSKRN